MKRITQPRMPNATHFLYGCNTRVVFFFLLHSHLRGLSLTRPLRPFYSLVSMNVFERGNREEGWGGNGQERREFENGRIETDARFTKDPQPPSVYLNASYANCFCLSGQILLRTLEYHCLTILNTPESIRGFGNIGMQGILA